MEPMIYSIREGHTYAFKQVVSMRQLLDRWYLA